MWFASHPFRRHFIMTLSMCSKRPAYLCLLARDDYLVNCPFHLNRHHTNSSLRSETSWLSFNPFLVPIMTYQNANSSQQRQACLHPYWSPSHPASTALRRTLHRFDRRNKDLKWQINNRMVWILIVQLQLAFILCDDPLTHHSYIAFSIHSSRNTKTKQVSLFFSGG